VDVVEPTLGMTRGFAKAASGQTQLKHWPEYLLLRALARLLRLLPLQWAVEGAAVLWRWVGPLLRQHRRALENLAVAFPDKTADERNKIARLMWANMGRVMAETVLMDRILQEPDRLEIAQSELWAPRMSQPGPSVGVTLHMGNWELAIWPLLHFGRYPAGVYRPLANPLVDRLLRHQRLRLYPGGLFGKGEETDEGKGGHRTARLMIDHVRRGGCMGFVCDHNDRRGVVIPFFGRRARFTPVPAMIARHVDARVWVGRCVRLGRSSRFRLDIEELQVPKSADRTEDTRALTAAIFAQFEAWIRETPEQWMWWNTRWVKD
jgi:Kdo2-lipid IVA lauroyltransferase/acyltransferase